MKSQNLIYAFLLVFFSVTGLAQETDTDAVYLKDGTIITGTIIDFVPGNFIDIQSENKIITIESKDIKRVVKNSADTSDFSKNTEKENRELRGSIPLDNSTIDEIHLKDGTVIQGELTNLKRGEYATITVDGVEEKYLAQDIRRIINEVPVEQVKSKKRKEKIDPRKIITQGFYNTTYLSFSYGETLDEETSIGAGAHTVFGIQKSPMLGWGLGIGVDNYRSTRAEIIFPIYLDYRIYPFAKHRGYYFNIGAGYGFAFKNNNRGIFEANGGPYASPVVGFRSASNDELSLNIELGYKYQTALFKEQSDRTFDNIQIRDNVYNRIVLRLGLMFWSERKGK